MIPHRHESAPDWITLGQHATACEAHGQNSVHSAMDIAEEEAVEETRTGASVCMHARLT